MGCNFEPTVDPTDYVREHRELAERIYNQTVYPPYLPLTKALQWFYHSNNNEFQRYIEASVDATKRSDRIRAFEWRHEYILTILTQDSRLLNVHNELYDKFPDIEDDQDNIHNIQTTIDECKKDLDDLYEEFNALLHPRYYTCNSVEMVRAPNIGPLDPVAGTKQTSTSDLEPDLGANAHLDPFFAVMDAAPCVQSQNVIPPPESLKITDKTTNGETTEPASSKPEPTSQKIENEKNLSGEDILSTNLSSANAEISKLLLQKKISQSEVSSLQSILHEDVSLKDKIMKLKSLLGRSYPMGAMK
jgi:hypothetical protein